MQLGVYVLGEILDTSKAREGILRRKAICLLNLYGLKLTQDWSHIFHFIFIIDYCWLCSLLSWIDIIRYIMGSLLCMVT